ncbi:uncharacterized protein TOL2_C34540 [Desulfobacula toluolica Tol2]|uniref:Uncharacterized protein n=1 Tax=Desulfobacula toluolica (strain DSM 7467 / Tol2) TaxID=651182 RepID=K0NJG4_DESTT|nr:uncharacterized protein TOL2_C34540 [Desulfobacula toluolica Tol2]
MGTLIFFRLSKFSTPFSFSNIFPLCSFITSACKFIFFAQKILTISAGSYIYFPNHPGDNEPLKKKFLMQGFLLESTALCNLQINNRTADP